MRSLSNFAGCAKLIETDPGRITAKRGILFNLCVIIKKTYVYFALSSSRHGVNLMVNIQGGEYLRNTQFHCSRPH